MTKRYTNHEWVELNGDIATVGISTYAAEQFGDVVYAELPDAGADFKQGDDMAVVESAKTTWFTRRSPAKSSRPMARSRTRTGRSSMTPRKPAAGS